MGIVRRMFVLSARGRSERFLARSLGHSGDCNGRNSSSNLISEAPRQYRIMLEVFGSFHSHFAIYTNDMSS